MALRSAHICCIVMVALQLSIADSRPVRCTKASVSELKTVNITTVLNQLTGGFRAVKRILRTNILPGNGIQSTANVTILKHAQRLSKLVDQERKLGEYLQMPEFKDNTEIAALHELVGILVKDTCNILKSALGKDIECTSSLWELFATHQLVVEELDNAFSYWCPDPNEECFLAPQEHDEEWVKKNIICSSTVSTSTVEIVKGTRGYSKITC